jgi:hypothetical protein
MMTPSSWKSSDLAEDRNQFGGNWRVDPSLNVARDVQRRLG